jgi:uncharacterized protein YlxW (UPF0749 family)
LRRSTARIRGERRRSHDRCGVFLALLVLVVAGVVIAEVVAERRHRARMRADAAAYQALIWEWDARMGRLREEWADVESECRRVMSESRRDAGLS